MIRHAFALAAVFAALASGAAAAPQAVVAPPAQSKSDVGLGNVDNTPDAGKPVSTAQATSIATKLTTPVLTTYTPTVTCGTISAPTGSGTYTSASATATYVIVSRMVTLVATLTIANAAGCSGNSWISLPTSVSIAGGGGGREFTATGVSVHAWAPAGGSAMLITNYNNGGLGSGTTSTVSASYVGP